MLHLTHGCRRFIDKVALVTGAGQGIGKAVALRLAAEGGRVVIADKTAEAAQRVATELRDQGCEALAVAVDLSTYSGACQLIEQAIEAYGENIDVLINNVGGTIHKKPFWHYTEEEIIAEINRSFWPTIWCCRAAIPYMKDKGGAIVNLGSNAVSSIFRIPYSAAKGGVMALTTALAEELADFGIRVNCVSPGGTAVQDRVTARLDRPLSDAEKQWEAQFLRYVDEETLLGRYATVEEQAAAICFLASDEAAHITGVVLDTGKRGLRFSKVLGEKFS